MQAWIHRSLFSCSVISILLVQSGLAWSEDEVTGSKQYTQSEQVALIHKEDAHLLPSSRPGEDVLSVAGKEKAGLVDESYATKDNEIVSARETDTEIARAGEAVTNTGPTRKRVDERAVRMIRKIIWMSLFYSGSN